MIRDLKALGLALVAVFALGAVVASGASAQKNGTLKVTPKSEAVTLTATETGVAQNWLEAFSAKIECPGSTFTGHKVRTVKETEENKKHELIPPGSETFTITPHWKEVSGGAPNCKVPGLGLTMTIDMNGCDFVFHLGETTPGVDTYSVTVDIVCPIGKQIEATLWTGSHANTTFCSFDIPAQIGLKGAHATDTTNDHIDITGRIKGITATKTKHGAGVLCPHEETKAAELNIDLTVTGHNAAGEPVGIGSDHA